ncbi:MAG TPA: PAS domain S-box protein [Actinomycetota bacterium]|nr:PAS domain S-box protein [Actinomycetota bacterium]
MTSVEIPAPTMEEGTHPDIHRLAAIVQSSGDAIIGKTTVGVVTSWNPAATDLFGWTSIEMVGRPMAALIPTHRREEETELLLRVAAGERIDPYETERLTKAGATIRVALSSSPIRDATGAIEGVASIYIDIGWIKKREVVFQTLLDAAHDAIVGVDSDGSIKVVNVRAEKLFGYDQGELIGQPVDTLVPERLKDLRPAHRSSYFAQRTTRPIGTGLELNAVRKDGSEFQVDIALSSLETEEGIIGVAVRDISDRIQAALEKDQLEQRLSQSRLESVGQLVGGIAHDFNNLLAGVMFFSRLVQDGLEQVSEENPATDLEQVEGDVGQIIHAAGRATSLIRQLLLFGRQDVVQPETVDLNELIRGMEDLLRRTLGEQVILIAQLKDPLGNVFADVGHLEQVLMNLVVNARDAMASGGRLTVRTTEKTLDDAYPPPQGVEEGDYVVLSISDTGAGMPPEVVERAFEPYFSTKPRGEGSGLGLATVHGVVEQAGGHISIFSEVGLGTTVSVYFPATPGLVDTPAAEVVTTPRRGAGETILLVEDESFVREPTARFLRSAGYEVLVAAGPDQALQLARAHGQPIDLLLTDVVMPGMTGKQLSDRLFASSSVDHVLYTSGYSQEGVAHPLLEPGEALLQKPFLAEKLLTTVQQVLDGSGNE